MKYTKKSLTSIDIKKKTSEMPNIRNPNPVFMKLLRKLHQNIHHWKKNP